MKCDEYLAKVGKTPTSFGFKIPFGTTAPSQFFAAIWLPRAREVKHSAVPKEMFQAVLKGEALRL